MPPMRISLKCNNERSGLIFEHFKAETLIRGLGELRLPAVFVLGADSPLWPHHNIATAQLLPNATYQIEDIGHLVWMERPGTIRRDLDGLAARAG